MDDIEFIGLVLLYQDGGISPHDLVLLENAMVTCGAKRELFAETQVHAAILREKFRQEAFLKPRRVNVRGWFHSTSRLLVAVSMMVMGIVMGLAGSGFVWAVSSNRIVATMRPVPELVDGGFERSTGPLPSGFPDRTGIWSGDSLETVSGGAREGINRLRFRRAEADANAGRGRAISCDVFQMVDLRDMIAREGAQRESVLELSAEFADERPLNTNPSVTFFCQVYLFRCDASEVGRAWPANINDAVATGSAETTTLGSAPWARVRAKCLLAPEASCAVIHLAARPNLRGPMPDSLFVDDVRLKIKTQPLIPIDIVER